MKEKVIERLILTWLSFQPECKIWKNKSLGVYDPTKKVFRTSIGHFSEKGTSDILGIIQGKMLCIEVKSKTGKLSPHQKTFLEEMTKLGAIAFMARSLDEVVEQLKTRGLRIRVPGALKTPGTSALPFVS